MLSRAGRWSRATRIADDGYFILPPLLAGNARGDLAVAWQPSWEGLPPVYRLRPAGSGRWSAPTAPFGSVPVDARVDTADLIQAVAVDNAGRLHLLVTDRSVEAWGWPGAVHHERDGRVDGSLIALPQCRDREECAAFPYGFSMAYDPVTDRLVLTEQHGEMRDIDGRSRRVLVLTIADKPAAAAAFGPSHEAARTRYTLAPASLCARGGQITVTLSGWRKGHTPYVMTGSAPDAMGTPVRVSGTTVRDTASPISDAELRGVPIAAAASRGRVFIAWQRDSIYRRPSWDRKQQGIWLREYVRDPASGVWQFRPAPHLTNSAYDRLDSLSVGADGPAVGSTTYN
jgi:hypothetical protein